MDDPFNAIIRRTEYEMFGLDPRGQWLRIGSFETLAEAHERFDRMKPSWPLGLRVCERNLTERRKTVLETRA